MNNQIFIVLCGDKVGAIKDLNGPVISSGERSNFLRFVKKLMKKFPKCKFRCVIDKAMENKVRIHIALKNKFMKARER